MSEPDLLLVADNGAGDLLGRAAKVGVGVELHMALVVRAVVYHRHLAVLVHPELPDDNVVDDSLDLPPRVVVAALREHAVVDAQGLDLDVLACNVTSFNKNARSSLTLGQLSLLLLLPLNFERMLNSCHAFHLPEVASQYWPTIGG